MPRGWRHRALVESVAPDEAEFFDANLSFEDQAIEGFSAVNPLCRVNCVDCEKSDFKLTNFDPANPTCQFYYQVLLGEIPSGAQIAICSEHPRQIVVGQAIKDACRSRPGGIELLQRARHHRSGPKRVRVTVPSTLRPATA